MTDITCFTTLISVAHKWLTSFGIMTTAIATVHIKKIGFVMFLTRHHSTKLMG